MTHFSVVPLGRPTVAMLCAMAGAVLVLAAGLAVLLPTPPWITAAATLGLLAIAGLLGYFLYGGLSDAAVVDDQVLRINAPIYGRSIPRKLIDAKGVRTITLASNPTLRPRIRTNGLSVPGYHIGRFRLADGSRAFVLLTSTSGEIVHVPLTDGTAALVSVQDASGLVAALRTLAG